MGDIAEDKWIDIEGLRIHYLEAGQDEPALLLLHGAGLDSAKLSYSHSIPQIARSCRVIAPDLPGYGQSDKPDVDYSTEYHIDFLTRFLSRLNIENACLSGLSMGGAVVLGYALRHPEKANRLILVSSYGMDNVVPGRLVIFLMAQIPFLPDIATAALCRSRAFMKWGLRRLVYNKSAIGEDTIEEACRLSCSSCGALAFRAYERSEITLRGLRTDFSEALRRITAPTLILHGYFDRFVPRQVAENAARSMPNATLRLIPACGHWIPLEYPRIFADAALEFLKRNAQ